MAEVRVVVSVVINTQNHDELVEFWKSLLGVEVAQSIPPYFTWLKSQHQGGVMVAIQAVPDPTPGRRRLHLDTVVPDMDAAVQRITELGGSFVEDHAMHGFQ